MISIQCESEQNFQKINSITGSRCQLGIREGLYDLLSKKAETNDENLHAVSSVIADIRMRGFESIQELLFKFDNFSPKSPQDLTINPNTIDEAYTKLKSTKPQLIEALEIAHSRVVAFHEGSIPPRHTKQDEFGNRLEHKWRPVGSAALYIPAGTAAYPSSVIMNAVPAIVAGSSRIAVFTPAKNGEVRESILATMKICGIKEGYKIGGAVAIAAAAFGVEEVISKFDKIVGPGNSYVSNAKKILFGEIGIDSIAGPTDVSILADKTANPRLVAYDMMAQAEHGKDSSSVLITDSADLALEVSNLLSELAPQASRSEILKTSLSETSRIFVVNSLNTEGVEIVNTIAPEHLEIITANANELEEKIANAGAIFINQYTCEALGDYLLGPSHTLPTGGSARFSSGLSVMDFLKKTSIMEVTNTRSLESLCRVSETIATEEGLDMHAKSAAIRLEIIRS